MNKRIIISIIAIVIVTFAISIDILGFIHRKKISNELSWAYWNFKRYGYDVETFAGCQLRTMMETKTDEEFSIRWEKKSKEGHFDAIDVDRHMLKYCPPATPEETRHGIEKYYKSYNKYLKEKGQPEIGEEKQEREIQERVERSISISEYKRKFLNREFTALKDEPREQ
ncbi:MAG: hypothetical protein ACWGHO_00060 [Candidatus Moraniibacteriota bacterium]